MKKGRENKPHIGIFGRRNNGKSSLINAIAGQDIAIVSDTAGTTTDPVKKSVEIFGIGPEHPGHLLIVGKGHIAGKGPDFHVCPHSQGAGAKRPIDLFVRVGDCLVGFTPDKGFKTNLRWNDVDHIASLCNAAIC